jgi:uncharacterized protein (DUF697 family)
MSKRKLPRAIMAEEPAFPVEYAAAVAERSEKSQPTGAFENSSNVIEIVSKKEPPRTAAPSAAAAPRASADTNRRRAAAHAIVNWHATFAALGGCIPLPFANFASVTALMVHMVKTLSRHYGVPFEHDRARAIVVSLVGGAMPSGLASVTTSTLAFIVPMSAVAGLAVSSATAATCTRAIGRVFVEHFESGATLDDIAAAQ